MSRTTRQLPYLRRQIAECCLGGQIYCETSARLQRNRWYNGYDHGNRSNVRDDSGWKDHYTGASKKFYKTYEHKRRRQTWRRQKQVFYRENALD